MANEACKLLRKIDGYFNNGIVDVTKFDKSNLFEYKCPYDRINKKFRNCENNNERINTLGGYLYENLSKIANNLNGKGDNGNRHIEIFIMWLCDKLYKLEENKTKTLDEFYKSHLEKYMPNFNYWNVIDSKKVYKKADVWYMSELYKLLNCICNIVIEYNKKNKINNKKKIEKYSSQCYEKFKSVYNNVKDCYSYFHLLKYLKSIYDNIRDDAIKDADTKRNAIKKAFITNNTFKKALSPYKNNLGEAFERILNDSTISLIDLTTSDWDQRFTDVSDKILDFHTQFCINSYSDLVEQVKKQQELESKNQPKAQPQTDPPPASSTKLPAPPQASQQSGTSPQSEKTDSSTQKGNSDSEGGGKGGTNNLSGNTSGGSGIGTGDTSGGKSDQGGSPDGSGSPVSGTGGTNGTPDSQGGSSNQGGSDDGSKALGNQVPTPPSGEPNRYLTNNWGTSFNLTGYMSSVSGIYESSKNILTNTANQVSNAYNSAMTIAQDTYNKTVDIAKNTYGSVVSTVKDTYTRSTDYISGAVNSITIQLNPFGSSQLGDNQPGSNSSGGGTDTSNQSQQNPPPPSLPPSSSPSVTPPSTPQPQTPPDPQTPSDPSSSKSLDPQTIPTHISKNSDRQSTSNAGKGVPQIPLSAQGTLPSSSTGPSTQGNGNTTGIVVKVKEISSIWCIGSNNKCGITGISIIVISIFAFLAIMYKYLSLGCTSKSKRKKSVKKVINSIGGKRPIQIIIKSYDRNKDLKPVINSVGRKKDPLLNIYKLMQADPIPFINLFFLLIFFVYKRKYNFLEL
ncbi:PIR protein CIR protein [Plasmodium vinckei petteri]|uniref:PIR protein CIR protein n=1 Tax=Plasmodium vinckei petteri TaxID=138298 RepID=A0A6V7SDX4_PLAVN|nr:PIR protein CIR protein [Plasmodium vinckei petteri]